MLRSSSNERRAVGVAGVGPGKTVCLSVCQMLRKCHPGQLAAPGLNAARVACAADEGASSTPTTTAVLANSKQPERMDDAQVFHFTAGGKRGETPSPAAAQVIAASRALPKKGREFSPTKGLNPSALTFQPSAAADQSGQQIGDAANFTRTFTRPASSDSNVRGSVLPQAEQSGHSVSAGIISGNGGAG